MSVLQQWEQAQADPQVVVNENFEALEHAAVYGKDATSTGRPDLGLSGWALGRPCRGGRHGGACGQLHPVVVARATGVLSVSSSSANWSNTAAYARVYKLTTAGDGDAVEDWRAAGRVSMGRVTHPAAVAARSRPFPSPARTSTPLTAGTAKVTFRMPFAMNLSAVRASLTTAQASGSILTVDINAGGTSILSTKLTIDNTEKTSTTAAAAAVISSAALADDAEITIDVDQVGSGSAAGLKVYLIGVPA
jgi:hypothetical protein